MAVKAKSKKTVVANGERVRTESGKRQYVSQIDVPALTLDQALRVGRELADNYAGKSAKPIALAQALTLAPNSSTFRVLCGASVAYGLTEGGAFSDSISLTPLGKRILRPTKEGDDAAARREAFLRPRVIRDFLGDYDQARLPRPDIAHNVLMELKVPKDAADRTFSMISDGAQAEGLLREIKGERYVDLTGIPKAATTTTPSVTADTDEPERDSAPEPEESDRPAPRPAVLADPPDSGGRTVDELRRKRVYISHGKNLAFIEPIKKLLGFGELEPIVSVERSSVSIPVPAKVMADMRSCGAAIIHVDAEIALIDKEAKEHKVLNPNVLIEIGAAMALYGDRFILLVRDGLSLPSNLQGLHEVRYTGDTLDGNATIRLLEAINDIKNHALPLLG